MDIGTAELSTAESMKNVPEVSRLEIGIWLINMANYSGEETLSASVGNVGGSGAPEAGPQQVK